MHTALISHNRVRRFLPPVTGFGQWPPSDVERVLWFLAGFVLAIVTMLVRR